MAGSLRQGMTGTLALSGEVNIHTGGALRDQARRLLASCPETLVRIDCSALGRSDSVCLSLLLCMQRDARALGKRLLICALPEELRRIAGLYGLLDLLPLDAGA